MAISRATSKNSLFLEVALKSLNKSRFEGISPVKEEG